MGAAGRLLLQTVRLRVCASVFSDSMENDTCQRHRHESAAGRIRAVLTIVSRAAAAIVSRAACGSIPQCEQPQSWVAGHGRDRHQR